ncbi:MAG TPA: hypothetical protein VIL44_03955 [Micromonospora sp.]
MDLPDVSAYRLHRVVPDIDLDGVVVPGLTATFYRRDEGDRIRTVGVYRYAGVAVVMAWGFVGEAHCRYTAVRRTDGGWDPPRPGCPPVERIESAGRISALRVGPWVFPTADGSRTAAPPGLPRATSRRPGRDGPTADRERD